MVTTVRPAGARTIEEILAAARARLVRLTPQQAFAELSGAGVLIDIRPAWQRANEGEIPGSVVVERNHLEWRLDPCSEARLPWVGGYDHRVIVICQEGFTSSLAAAALLDLGLHRATAVIGGAPAGAAPARRGGRGRPATGRAGPTTARVGGSAGASPAPARASSWSPMTTS